MTLTEALYLFYSNCFYLCR